VDPGDDASFTGKVPRYQLKFKRKLLRGTRNSQQDNRIPVLPNAVLNAHISNNGKFARLGVKSGLVQLKKVGVEK
jgi:hypothetical protein